MVKFEYALDREKGLNCLVNYYLNTKENKKKRLIMRSIYLMLALLLGIFTDLYLAVVCLVVLTFFIPEFVQKNSLKKHFLSVKCDALYEKYTYAFSENGVVIESDVSVKEYKWAAFINYDILIDSLYIVQDGGAIIVFNKERMDKEIFDRVLELVQQNIDKKGM